MIQSFDVVELTKQAYSDITVDVCQEFLIVEWKCRQLIEGQHSWIDITKTQDVRTLLTNYDRYGNRTYPSGQIEEDYDGTLLFSKYLCERDDRAFSLIRERPGSYSYMHSTSDTWWGNSLNKDGLVLHCKESYLETVSACF